MSPSATRQYRLAIDEGVAGRRVSPPPEQLLELESPFSRGLSQGWLAGRNLQIVDGRNSANRGICIGKVTAVRGDRVAVELTAPLRRGDGVAFPSILGEAHDQGGRVYEIFAGKLSIKESAGGPVELAFGRDALEFDRLQPGQELWKTDDPQIDRRLRKTFANGRAQRRVPLDLTVEAAVGRKLRDYPSGPARAATCRVESEQELGGGPSVTRSPPRCSASSSAAWVRASMSLRGLEARIEGRPMAPLSVLGQLRHAMIRLLDAAAVELPQPRLLARPPLVPPEGWGEGIALPALPMPSPQPSPGGRGGPVWHVLCRELKQVEEVLALGVKSIVADFAELHRCAHAVRMAREHHAEIFLATPRIQKPGEEAHFARLADAEPDGLLVRNLGGAAFCAQRRIPFVADMSLNAVNEWTVAWLHELGACRVTAAYDADRQRLSELAEAAPWAELEVVVYQHLPLFHTEHCLFDTEVGGRRNEARPKTHAGGRRPPDPAPRGAVQFRLHEARDPLARPLRRGASLAVGCLLPQHALSRPAAESHRPRSRNCGGEACGTSASSCWKACRRISFAAR